MTANTRPLILIDVDDVLNRLSTARERKHLARHGGWVNRWGYANGERWRLFLYPAHGPMLLQMAEETGAELAWATTWNELANIYVRPHLGLPELPVAPAPMGRKAEGVVPWTAGRPFVWFDDDLLVAENCAHLAQEQPHLVVQVDERTGLTGEHIEQGRAWLTGVRV